jgi:hypothetical protein
MQRHRCSVTLRVGAGSTSARREASEPQVLVCELRRTHSGAWRQKSAAHASPRAQMTAWERARSRPSVRDARLEKIHPWP